MRHKERVRTAELQSLPRFLDAYRLDGPIRRYKVQLFTVLSPARIVSARRGYLIVPLSVGKIGYVNLRLAWSCRQVRHPPAAGRDSWISCGKLPLYERKRLPVSKQRQNPHSKFRVAARLRVLISKIAPIAASRARRIDSAIRLQYNLRSSGSG